MAAARIPVRALGPLLRQALGVPAKYKNRAVRTAEGYFASEGEYARWNELRLLERQGLISKLGRQRRFRLVVRKLHVADYVSDFDYEDGGVLVVEDAKGFLTDVYKLKRRLMLALHGIAIREVRCPSRGRPRSSR